MSEITLYIIIVFLIICILTGILFMFRHLRSSSRLQSKSDTISSPSFLNQKNSINISGIVMKYVTNHIGDADKVIINSENEKIAVHFPPHIGKQIVRILEVNKKANLIVSPSKKKDHDFPIIYELIAIKNSSRTIDIDNFKTLPIIGKPMVIVGFITRFQYNKQHFISGFIIEGYLIDIPPHFGEIITPILNKESEITIRGYIRTKNNDFINKSGFEIVRPYAISIDNTDYLL